MGEKTPIRQRRKAETRQRLIVAAHELFREQGYENTTLEGIATHAGYHVQTLYRHFSNKIELASAGEAAQLNHFSRAIRSEERTGTTFQFWRDYVSGLVDLVTAVDGGANYREVLRNEIESPVVAKYMAQLGSEYTALLAESLEPELITTDPRERSEIARLIAITLWGAHQNLMSRYDQQEFLDLLDKVIATNNRVQQLYAHLFRTTPR